MSLSSSQDLEIKNKSWENLSHDLTELTVQDIADIMNKTASLSRVDESGSCAWCGDLVKERRYLVSFDLVEDSQSGFLGENYGLTKFYATYDVQINNNKLNVSLITSAGAKAMAHHLNDTILYVAFLEVLKNGVLIEKQYFEVLKNKPRVNWGIKKRAGSELTYVGEVNLELPDPTTLKDNDKIELRFTVNLELKSISSGGSITSEKTIEVRHDEFEYIEER